MEINQYHGDVPFNKKYKKFNLNDYRNYKSKEYYTWINNNLNEYSFPSNYLSKSFEDICENVDYSLKPQQKLAGRILNTAVDNNGMLVYHGLGSGKTQTSIVIGEAFKFRNSKGGTIIPGRSDTNVLIVVPANLVEQYYSELIGYVENGEIKSASGQVIINGHRQFYLNKKLRNAIKQNTENIKELQGDPKNKEKILELERMNKELYDHEKEKIKTVYTILSHEKFLNRLFTIKNGNFIEGEYLSLLQKRNGLLIIDEAHSLVSAIGSNYRKLLIALRYYTVPTFRTVLLTGSPIYDKPFEFGLLINLLRPRMLFPDGFEKFNEVFVKDKKFVNKDLFKQMCSGYVSYFKGGNPEAYPYKKVIIMHHQMEPYQYSVYKNALLKEVERDKNNKLESKEEFIVRVATTESKNDETVTSVFNNSRLFCNITFPETINSNVSHSELVKLGTGVFEENSPGVTLPPTGQLYEMGVKEYLKMYPPKGRKTRQQIIKQGFEEFRKKLKGNVKDILKIVKGFSSKFAKVAELIMESEGPVFVYSNYVYYGVDSMALVMDSLGYKKYPQKGPLGSYFIWKGETDDSEIKKAYRAFNNIKNKDGSQIRIMFGTQSVMEGVDFKRVRQVHVLDPWWNDSRMQQVIARAIRLCSHKDLPVNKRIVDVFIHLSSLGSSDLLYELKIIENSREQRVLSTLEPYNITEKNNSKWNFYKSAIKNTEVYNLKETFNVKQIVPNSIKKMADPELSKKIGKWKNMDTISVEEYMYNRALTKLDLNRQFEMAIKESAVDCTLNKNGNILRLEEHYEQVGENFKRSFLNYSTGEVYRPLNIEFVTLKNVLESKKNESTEFKNENDEIVTLPVSLIVHEDINCSSDQVYSFNSSIPINIVNLTINKEYIPYLKKISLDKLKQFFFDVEHSNIKTSDPSLVTKLKKFYTKKALEDKQNIIDSLKATGIDEDIWDLYTTEELKKIASKIFKKGINE